MGLGFQENKMQKLFMQGSLHLKCDGPIQSYLCILDLQSVVNYINVCGLFVWKNNGYIEFLHEKILWDTYLNHESSHMGLTFLLSSS
jgi:hypothetical protein